MVPSKRLVIDGDGFPKQGAVHFSGAAKDFEVRLFSDCGGEKDVVRDRFVGLFVCLRRRQESQDRRAGMREYARHIVFLLGRVRFFVNAPAEIAAASVAQNPFRVDHGRLQIAAPAHIRAVDRHRSEAMTRRARGRRLRRRRFGQARQDPSSGRPCSRRRAHRTNRFCSILPSLNPSDRILAIAQTAQSGQKNAR